MYELIRVGENSFYMDCPAKVGIFRVSEGHVVAIDSGSDKDAAKKLKKILDAEGWTLDAVYNTHSHADHIGGNQYLQGQTGCKIYAPGIDCAVTNFPVLEPDMLYGGFSMEDLHSKFLMAKESFAEPLSVEVLPAGLEIIQLPGHCFSMVGFRTSDNVVYLADCLSSRETIEKYGIGYLYDVDAYIKTLEMVKGLSAACFVPSHAEHTADIADLAQFNIDKTLEISEKIRELLEAPLCFEDLLAKVFEAYNLAMNLPQRFLIGSTVKSYLSYLKNKGAVDYCFENNRMLWKKL